MVSGFIASSTVRWLRRFDVGVLTSGRHPSIYLRGSIVALSIVALVWFDSSTASAGTVFVLEADEDVVTFENPDSENEATDLRPVSYTHLRAHETREDLGCRLGR